MVRVNENENGQYELPNFPKRERTKKRWLVTLAAAAGAILPVALQAGLLGPDVALFAVRLCEAVALHPAPRSSSSF